jgi:hypothetical protein
MAVGVLQQIAEVHNASITESVENICKYLPEVSSKGTHIRDDCKKVIHLLGPVLIELFVCSLVNHGGSLILCSSGFILMKHLMSSAMPSDSVTPSQERKSAVCFRLLKSVLHCSKGFLATYPFY